MNKKIKLSLTLGLIVIIATALVVTFARPIFSLTTIVSFFFLIYSEIVFFCGFILVEFLAEKYSKIIIRFELGLLFSIYSLIVFISSLIYMNTHILRMRGFMISQILLLVVMIIIALLIATFSKLVKTSDGRVLQANAMCKNFESELILIQEKAPDSINIHCLIEGIKYSDMSLMADADVEIDEKISTLKELVLSDKIVEETISNIVEEINFLIKKRNLQVKNKRQSGL